MQLGTTDYQEKLQTGTADREAGQVSRALALLCVEPGHRHSRGWELSQEHGTSAELYVESALP